MTKVHWREYTTREINRVKREKCINCKYAKKFGSSGAGAGNNKQAEMAKRPSGALVNIGNIFCDYLMMTGERRCCRPEICDKYEPRKKEAETNDRDGLLLH